MESAEKVMQKPRRSKAAGLGSFAGNWDTLGRHPRNAQGQYDEGQKNLTQFQIQLEQIQQKEE